MCHGRRSLSTTSLSGWTPWTPHRQAQIAPQHSSPAAVTCSTYAQEFTEDLIEYVTVMLCATVRGRPVFGAIYRPFSDEIGQHTVRSRAAPLCVYMQCSAWSTRAARWCTARGTRCVCHRPTRPTSWSCRARTPAPSSSCCSAPSQARISDYYLSLRAGARRRCSAEGGAGRRQRLQVAAGAQRHGRHVRAQDGDQEVGRVRRRRHHPRSGRPHAHAAGALDDSALLCADTACLQGNELSYFEGDSNQNEAGLLVAIHHPYALLNKLKDKV